MGHWTACAACQGSGTIPCGCSEEEKDQPCCDGGRKICSSCHGCGLIYISDGDDEDEFEFVYDEY